MVYDESGAPIRRVEGSIEAGFQRTAWDLRYPVVALREHEDDEEDFPPASSRGILVLPGAYSVRCFEKAGWSGDGTGCGAEFQSRDRGGRGR